MKKRANTTIEAFRFFSCIMIIFCHCPFPYPVGKYVTSIARYAVPFFLLISGYFNYGIDETSRTLKKLKDMASIVLTYGALCFLWNSVNCYIQAGSFSEWAEKYMTVRTLKEFLFYNRAIFFNSVFYYLFMMIYVYAIMLIILKTNHHDEILKFLYIIAPILLIISYIVSNSTNHPWYHAGNFMLTGLPLFIIGRFLHENNRITDAVSGKEPILFFASIIITVIEINFTGAAHYVYIGQILFAISLFCFCINNPNRILNRALVFLGSNCSLLIMIIHCEVRDSLSIVMDSETLVFPVIVVAVSVIISIIFRQIT